MYKSVCSHHYVMVGRSSSGLVITVSVHVELRSDDMICAGARLERAGYHSLLRSVDYNC